MKKIKYLVILFFILFSCQKFELLEHSNPLEDGRPFVSTIKSDFITSTTAELYAEIISTGELNITSFGHCWSTSNTPTIENMYQDNDNYTSNKYVTNITGLNSLTKYYFRAYAINSIGTAYGEVLIFTTNEAGEPKITTSNASDITSISVNLEGEIYDIGMALITQHGHCWSTGQNPTIGDSKTSLGAIGVGSFISNVSSLTQNTTYYFRAYATNTFGTVYGSSLSFSTTNGEPTAVTIGSSNISASSVDFEGEVTGIGDSPVTQHGHCWSTGQNPTIGDSKTSLGAIGVGSFISNVSNLTQNTTYYYRAYATNSFGTVYGSSMSFITLNGGATVFTTGNTNITDFSAELVGSINTMGSDLVIEHGHCFSSTNQNPTTSGARTTLGVASLGSFNSLVGSLSANTTYYHRAYATNSFGTIYGSSMSFTTLPIAPPNGLCNITGINSSNTPYDLTLIPSSNTFNFGDNITINMYHPFYSAGQSSILLYENETLKLNLCSFCIFTSIGSGNYQRTITLPSSSAISPSNCYTIRVLGTSGGANAYLNISNPITIY